MNSSELSTQRNGSAVGLKCLSFMDSPAHNRFLYSFDMIVDLKKLLSRIAVLPSTGHLSEGEGSGNWHKDHADYYWGITLSSTTVLGVATATEPYSGQ
jgi:hypothetical protein